MKFSTKILIPSPNVNQSNVSKFVSNQYLGGWFYFIATTHYLAFSLYQAGTGNVLYLRYTQFRGLITDINILLHTILITLVLSMAFKYYY